MRIYTNSRTKTSRTQQLRSLILGACCFLGLTTGVLAQNTSYGVGALSSLTTGNLNAAFGDYSLFSNTIGNSNSAHGIYSLYSNIDGEGNSAIGAQSLFNNSSGSYNSTVGYLSLYNNTIGYGNSAHGYAAMYSNTTGNENSALGTKALGSNTSGNNNSAFGMYAITNNISGSYNSAFGSNALYSNQVNSYNSAFGTNALENNTTDYSSAFGTDALRFNTTGYGNSSFGYASLLMNTTGGSNSAFGYKALQNSNGDRNSAFGEAALNGNATGNNNSALGYGALAINSTGSCNTAVGYNAGPSVGNLQNTIAIGCNATVAGSNRAVIGNPAMVSIGGFTNWTNLSDGRFKTNVENNVPGIEFIKKLQPVTYTYNLTAFDKWRGFDESTMADCYTGGRAAKEAIRYTGFIAQDVEKAAQELKFDFSGVDKPQNDQTPYGLRYAEFVVPLVKAVQEQQEIIELQNKRAEVQQQKIEEQAYEISTLKQQLEQRLERLEQLLGSPDKKASGTVETGDNSLLQVYPNPTDGITKISIGNETRQLVQFQLSDITGKVLLTRTASDSVINMTLDLSGFSAGTYMLTVTQGNQIMTKAIVLGGK